MASTTYHKIQIQKGEDPTIIEALAAEAGIGPGDLLEWSAGTFLRHNSAGGAVMPKLIALESPTNDPDSDTSFAVDVDYDNGDTVYAWIPKPGDHAYMLLAAGETAAQHAYLESNGDGALQVEAALTDADVIHAIVGRAVAAVDNSLGGSPVRVVVEIA